MTSTGPKASEDTTGNDDSSSSSSIEKEEDVEDGNDNIKDGDGGKRKRRRRSKSNSPSQFQAYTVENPLNREPELKELVSSYITEKNGYDRNHGPIPYLDASTHKVTIDGLVRDPQSLSIHQLRNDFRQHSVTCALQCAGNRRHTMRTRLKEVSGIDWFDGAVMNCQWSGPLLGDVLRSVGAGVGSEEKSTSLPSDDNSNTIHASEALHVAFASHQTPCQDDSYYGSSIPLDRCLRPSAEIVLALDMNGSPLTPKRGFPLRVVAPGIAGARAVKWLDRITVQASESPNFYQQRDYKILPPEAVDARAAEEWWPRVPAIQDMPVNSVVAVPGSGETVSRKKKRNGKSTTEENKDRKKVDDDDDDDDNGKIYTRGYALPAGEDGPVVRVQVSGDEGLTWTDARLLPSSSSSSPAGGENVDGDVDHVDDDSHQTRAKSQELNQNQNQNQSQNQVSKWAWTLWEAYIHVEPGPGRRILSRAIDKAGNTQPACPQWNFRGVAYNGYGEADGLTVV